MHNTLVKLANRLDLLGEYDLANELDNIILLAAKDKSDLEDKLEEVKKQLCRADSTERLKELHEVKNNIEEDLQKLDENHEEKA